MPLDVSKALLDPQDSSAERDARRAHCQHALGTRFPLLLDGLDWSKDPERARANLRGRLVEGVHRLDAEAFEQLLVLSDVTDSPGIGEVVRLIAYDARHPLRGAALHALAEEGDAVAQDMLRRDRDAAIASMSPAQKVAAVFGDSGGMPSSSLRVGGPESQSLS